jgi:dTMP kinase
LFIGGRVQLVEGVIEPALAEGQTVVCDRFHDATLAYQGFGGGVDVRWLDRVGRSAIHGVMPAMTFLLDIPTEQGFSRLHRSRDRMERKASGFHRRVRAGYLRLAAREPRRFVVVDASKSPEDVRRQIEAIAMPRLKRHFS